MLRYACKTDASFDMANRRHFMRKPIIKLILLFTSIFLILFMTACAPEATPEEEKPYVVSISVDTNTIPESSVAGQVDVSQIELIVVMNTGDILRVPLEDKMIFTSDRGKLLSTGTHHISVIYGGMSTRFSITIDEAPIVEYTLTIYDGAILGREPIDGVWTGGFEAGKRVTIVATDKSADGYYFHSWRIGGQVYNTNASCDITINGNISIYAHYELIKYKVSFNSNGGTSVAQMETRTIEAPPETTRPEYVFVGWREPDTNTIITYPFTVPKNITLTAVWESLGLEYDKAPTASGYTIVNYTYNGPRDYLTIPDTYNGYPIVAIAREAFANATNLRTLKLNRYITEIADYAFAECINLQSFEKDPSSDPSIKEIYEVNNGVIYKDDQLTAFPAGRLLESFDVERVSSIGTAAFYNANIGSINIKTNLNSIGADAFNSRTIDNVIFHNAINPAMPYSTNIFNDNISKIFIVQNMYVSNYKAHSSFSPYVDKIEELVQNTQLGIYDNLLYRVITREIAGISTPTIEIIGADRSLRSLTISTTRVEGKDITSIGRYAFSYCYNLETVTVHQQSKLDRILEGAFDNTKWQEQPTHNYIRNGAIIMNGILFRLLQDSKEYTVPHDVIKLGEESFSNKALLEKVIFGVDNNGQRYITSIENGAFKNCINLKEIVIPKKVTKLGAHAFENTKLSAFSFEEDSELTTVLDFCFQNASHLRTIAFGEFIQEIGRGVFNGCYSLESIAINGSIEGSNEYYVAKDGVLFQKNKDLVGIVDNFGRILHTYPAGRTAAVYQLPYDGETGVTHINEFAFYYSNIAAVVLPPTLESIVSKSFVIPQLVYIEFSAALEDSVSSYSILFPEFGAKYIILSESDTKNYGTWGAPEGVIKKKGTGDGRVDVTNLVGLFNYQYTLDGVDRNDTFIYRYDESGLYIIGAERTSALLSVPSIIDIDSAPQSVIGIGGYAFNGSMLTEVVLPSTLSTIEAYAFYYSSSLKRLTINRETAPTLEYSGDSTDAEDMLSFNPDTIIQNALLFVPEGAQNEYVSWTTSIDFVIAIGSQPQILFDTNEGTAPVLFDSAGEPIDMTDLAVIPSAPITTREGYVFDGWYADDEFTTEIVFPYTKHRNITFYAKWRVRTFIIVYDTSGGYFDETPVTSVNYGEGYSLTVPQKPGYVFEGWFDIEQRQYTEGDGTGTGIGSPEHILNGTWGLTANAQLVAKWSPKEFVVTYDATGGTVSQPTHTVEFNAEYTLEIPERVGYTFGGWQDSQQRWLTYSNGQSINEWAYTQDITAYAVWTALSYEVRFNAGENATSFPMQTVVFGEQFTFPVPTKAGSVFFGWYDGEGGTGTQYTDQFGNSVRAWDKAGIVIDMYAQWPQNITDASDFVTVRNNPEGSYILTNDIILDEEWVPIGIDASAPFTGIIDGNGYSIFNMTVTNKNSGYVGFVGYNKGIIRNLNLGISYIEEQPDTTNKAVINVESSENPNFYAGGMVAYNDTQGVITNCKVAVDITVHITSEGSNMYVGGMVGYNKGQIKDSYLKTQLNTSFDEGLVTPGNESRGAFAGFHAITEKSNIVSCRYERIVPSADFVSVACGNQNDPLTFGPYSATTGVTTQDGWDSE